MWRRRLAWGPTKLISKEHLVKTLDLRVENGEDMDQALKPWIKKQSKGVDWLRVVKSQKPRSSGGDLTWIYI